MSDENDHNPAHLLRELAALTEKQERARRADEDRKPVLGFCVDVHSAELGKLVQEKLHRLEELEIPRHDHFSKIDRVRAQRILSCMLPYLIEGITYRLSMAEMATLVGPETFETASMMPGPFPQAFQRSSYQDADLREIEELELQKNGKSS